MNIAPDDYSALGLPIQNKRVLTSLKKVLDDEFDCLIDIYPISGKKIDFSIIHNSKGIYLIQIDMFEESQASEEYISLNQSVWENRLKMLSSKLEKNSLLVNDNKIVFPYYWLYYFPYLEDRDLNESLKGKSISKNIIIIGKETITNSSWIEEFFINNSKSSILEHHRHTTEQINAMIHMLAPQYVILKHANVDLKDENIANISNVTISKKETYVKYFRLTKDQINIVNKLKIGSQLLLACAGSGKSVMLISKAFKIASEYPDKKVLLTCFNRNLGSYYDWQIDCAGLRSDNLICCTFFSLVQRLLTENSISYEKPGANDDSWNNLFIKAFNELKKGNIKNKYYAIFIDEIQIFKKEWYEFCFHLLEDKINHVFVIAGDKSQKVNDNIEMGMAPWQIDRENYPNFENNTIRVEYNYRNCKQINDYINRFVARNSEYFKFYDIIYDEDLFLRGQAVRDGYDPEVIQSNRGEEVSKVMEVVEELNKLYKVGYSDMAILFPYRQYKPAKFFIHKWLEEALYEKGIKFNFIGAEGTRVGDSKGLNLLTLETTLGLDFEAVILCGLLPMGKYNKMYRHEHFEIENNTEEKKGVFFKSINQLYVACTRARSHLYIILDEDPSNNIYSEVLSMSSGG